jgi:hypothetical protein
MKFLCFDFEPSMASTGVRCAELSCGRVRVRVGVFDSLNEPHWSEHVGLWNWITMRREIGTRAWQLRVDVFAVAMVIQPKGGPQT